MRRIKSMLIYTHRTYEISFFQQIYVNELLLQTYFISVVKLKREF